MNILTCLCCPVPDHVKTGIGYISLFAIMDAESDEPRAKRAKVQRQLDFFFNKPLVRERRYLFSIVTNISYFIVRYFDVKHHAAHATILIIFGSEKRSYIF
jgi:hypothetical protein